METPNDPTEEQEYRETTERPVLKDDLDRLTAGLPEREAAPEPGPPAGAGRGPGCGAGGRGGGGRAPPRVAGGGEGGGTRPTAPASRGLTPSASTDLATP